MKIKTLDAMKDDFHKENAIGDRVGCYKFIDNEKILFIGYGTYQGMYPCKHFGRNHMAKIKLDSGELIWGYECFYGSEEMIKNLMMGREVISV